VKWIKKEPAVFWSTLTGVIEAFFALAIGFSWIEVTTSQVGLIMLFIAALGTMFGFLTRSMVSPVEG